MNRSRLTTLGRAKFFLSKGGKCATCDTKCDRGWELDHILPLALGGTDEPDNWQLLCLPCHRAKTRGDVRAIRKSDRQRAKHLGARVSRNPLPFGKGSPLKKRMDGTVVRRER